MIMPMLMLMWEGFKAAMVCPLAMADRREKPVRVAALRRRGIVTR